MKNILIKDIPLLDRPRERFIRYGVNNLSNEELISIVLKNGVKDYSVKDLSNNILKSIKDITDLKDISINELTKIKGIGKVKAITLLASIELGKRVYQDKIADFFQSLTTSKEFVLLPDGTWDLKSNHKSKKIDMDDIYEEKEENEELDLEESDDENNEEDEYNSIDDEEEYAEDDLADLTILSEEELEDSE